MVGEDPLGDLLRHPEVVRVRAAGVGDLVLAEHLAGGVDARAPLWCAGLQEAIGDAHRLEHLERAGVDDGRPIPGLRPRALVDQLARDAPPHELRRQHEPGRSGTDDEHGGVDARVRHAIVRRDLMTTPAPRSRAMAAPS